MESIQTALNRWMQGKESFQQSMQQMRKDVLSSKDVQAFLKNIQS